MDGCMDAIDRGKCMSWKQSSLVRFAGQARTQTLSQWVGGHAYPHAQTHALAHGARTLLKAHFAVSPVCMPMLIHDDDHEHELKFC